MGQFTPSSSGSTNSGKVGGSPNLDSFLSSVFQQSNSQFVEQQDNFNNGYKKNDLNMPNDLESMPTAGKGAGQSPQLMTDSVFTTSGSALTPQRKIPPSYQNTVGLPDGTGINGAVTMSATSGQPQMGQPNTFSNTPPANNNVAGGKGKGA